MEPFTKGRTTFELRSRDARDSERRELLYHEVLDKVVRSTLSVNFFGSKSRPAGKKQDLGRTTTPYDPLGEMEPSPSVELNFKLSPRDSTVSKRRELLPDEVSEKLSINLVAPLTKNNYFMFNIHEKY